MDSKLNEALSGMILSASGWRGIFMENGDEENSCPEISDTHRIIAAVAAKVFSDYLSKKGAAKGAVIVGRDTRPTGEAIAEAIIRVLLAEKREVRYAGIAAAPEIMAFARSGNPSYSTDINNNKDNSVLGFIYISASHNPIGHNGIKFGLTDGGVLQGSETAKLVTAFRSIMDSPEQIKEAEYLLEKAEKEELNKVYGSIDKWKKAAMEAYRKFTAEVISGSDDKSRSDVFFESIRKGLEKHHLGIAVDFNGSARTVSIDRDFLKSLGAGFFSINDIPGKIAHRIVPEGESLDPCRVFMEELHHGDPGIILGYVPDCDGDRGNLVIWDDGEQKARSLEAQEVFALACMAELSSLVYTGELKYDREGKALVKAAIAVNDPTSLRIDSIAGAFDVSVFRSEVGEANAVSLARKLRGEGYLVRILGEGSAGGTITHPSAVRDPLDTLGAVLKLLAIREGNGQDGMGIFEIWCNFSNQKEKYRKDFSLTNILASLPAFITTGSYTDDALLKVKTEDHGLLKKEYQSIFMREWEDKKKMLEEQYGISSWEATAYNGMEEKRGIANFGDAGRGGLKIEFFGNPEAKKSGSFRKQGYFPNEAKIACIWMRGSGTEPIFRVMADVSATLIPRDSAVTLERFLINWQRRMVQEADK